VTTNEHVAKQSANAAVPAMPCSQERCNDADKERCDAIVLLAWLTIAA